MKVALLQPAYCTDHARSEAYFADLLELLSRCDESLDIIVLPESCDVPCLARTKEQNDRSVARFNGPVLAAAAETARRCGAMVFVNARHEVAPGCFRNTTHAFDRAGRRVGTYDKQHLVPSEISVMQLDSGYTYEHSEPTVIEMEGLRFAFLTCYDFYFYEAFPNIARRRPDFIIGCSHQRSDTHAASEIMSRFLAYNTNAYVLRASVSMDESSEVGGATMAVAPDGRVLCNLKSRVGLAVVDIDPTDKYYKPAGFGNPPAAHYEYIEKGRRPWKYRPAGSAIIPPDAVLGYPRVCAHRGFNTVAPENSMPAFGAAVALGAEEIEFDLWATADGELVCIHDDRLERVSNGCGRVGERTYAELCGLDFGSCFGEAYEGLGVVRFEDILRRFACHTVMNIHVKTPDFTSPYDRGTLERMVALIDRYDCRGHVYFMCGNTAFHELAEEVCPDICRCMGNGADGRDIVERALAFGCKKVQFFKGQFDKKMMDKAHENGLVCNVFYADTPEEARACLDMGADVILTNDYHRVSRAVREHKK